MLSKLQPAVVLATAMLSPFATAEPGTDARLYELRTYHAEAGKLDALLDRFRGHTVKLFEKHGITNLAYFRPLPGEAGAGDTLLYFLAHADKAAAEKSWKEFRADPVWVAAKAASEKAAGGSLTTADGVVSVFLTPTDFSPLK